MKVLNLNLALGIELVMLGDHQFSCRMCLLSRKKNALNIEWTKVIVGNLSTVLDAVPRQQPIALNLSGKGIIHKNIDTVHNVDESQLFSKAFPSVEREGFYVQQFGQQDNFVLSIIRRQAVDELLDKFERAGLNICMLSLGGLVCTHVLGQLNLYDTSIAFDAHAFVLDQQRQFLSYSYGAVVQTAFPVKVVQQDIDPSNIVAYASAFQLILNDQLTTVSADVARVNDQFANQNANRQFKQRALIFLFSIFGLLLLSFVIFNYYNGENEQLARVLGSQTASSAQLDLTKANMANNEVLLKQLNWNGGYNYGFLVNEIGSSMPRQLNLLELSINVHLSEREKLDPKPKIKLIGTTGNLTAVNNWIYTLKEKPWVKSVQLLKYQQDQETNDYQFNLMILY